MQATDTILSVLEDLACGPSPSSNAQQAIHIILVNGNGHHREEIHDTGSLDLLDAVLSLFIESQSLVYRRLFK